MKPTRRSVLQGLAAAAVAPASLSSAFGDASAPREPAGIIDTHQHLFDRSNPSARNIDAATPPARLGVSDYAKATQGLHIQAVYMEVDVPPAGRPAEAEEVISLINDKVGVTRASVIGGRPDSPDFDAYVRRFQASGVVRGVRQVLHSNATPPGLCLGDDFVKGVRLLGKLGLGFDLCMRPVELRDGLKLTELAPDTRFVLDHCGNADPVAFIPGNADTKPAHDPDVWRRDIDALAGRPNLICKISGIVARAPEKWTPEHLAPIVNHCLDAFGPDRVIFGGDWPICLSRATFRQWVDALTEIVANRPEPERRKLWAENARGHFKLEK